MSKITPSKPILLVVHGIPGSGKTAFCRQLCNYLKAVHVHSDRIRFELFDKPKYDNAENQVVEHLVDYMMEEFLNAGVSVIYDAEVTRSSQRRRLREVARKMKAQYLLVWLQIDLESAFTRVAKRDRRTIDDKFTRMFSRTDFDSYVAKIQNPTRDEDFIVLSGKHSFAMQRGALVKRMFELNIMSAENVSSNVIKPGMVNLIPNPGRVDMSRRNIRIR